MYLAIRTERVLRSALLFQENIFFSKISGFVKHDIGWLGKATAVLLSEALQMGRSQVLVQMLLRLPALNHGKFAHGLVVVVGLLVQIVLDAAVLLPGFLEKLVENVGVDVGLGCDDGVDSHM